MFSQTYMIAAYNPALAGEQSGKAQDQMAISNGRNFAWEGASVISAYASAPVEDGPTLAMRHPFQFTIQNRVFVFDQNRVLMRDELSEEFVEVFNWAVAPPAAPYNLGHYNWTSAWVGTKYVFSHPTVPFLICYDQFEDAWTTWTDECWNLPIYGVALAANRLVVLLTDVVVWSWFDEATRFEHLWQSGSGSQSLALIRYGQPYSVAPYNGGFLTFTSMGIMLSTPDDSQAGHPDGERLMFGALTYNHAAVSFEDCPIGPAAVRAVGDGLVVWLNVNGFRCFAGTQGGGFGAVQPWQPLMSMFYRDVVLRDRAGEVSDLVMLNYVAELNSVFVSVRTQGLGYSSAHVLQLDYDRWGSFDWPHKSVGPTKRGNRMRLNLPGAGFIGADGVVNDMENGPGAHAWVKFSPIRFQAPQEPALPATTLTSVQEVRLGTSLPRGKEPDALPFGLVSNWDREAFRGPPRTKCNVLVSGGWDENTANLDEGEYATLVLANAATAVYAVDVTGLTHSVFVICEADDHYFNISHVEATFFLAGQL